MGMFRASERLAHAREWVSGRLPGWSKAIRAGLGVLTTTEVPTLLANLNREFDGPHGMVFVNARRVHCIAYTPDTGELCVCLSDSTPRQYRPVPAALINALAQSAMPDVFFARWIESRYNEIPVDRWPPDLP
ncbi:hypothetical protein [Paraburkholderia aspalathi]|uniref:hypothetical protein n=1 Tax=Paraburkholderia aspalathi TaxID=1324617 RepID=UPI0038BAADE2